MVFSIFSISKDENGKNKTSFSDGKKEIFPISIFEVGYLLLSHLSKINNILCRFYLSLSF